MEGVVRDETTRDPIAGARVSIVETELYALTNENGYYVIDSVPVGVHNVRVQLIGFQAKVFTNQQVIDGLPTSVNFDLARSILRIEGVVVTGVAEQTQAVKLPFTVEHVSGDELPVAPQSADEAIRGKVAGVQIVSGSGLPGSESAITLRGTTSIDAEGRTNEPLYVVDGVIVGASMVDIDALSIESIEVVKGAAGAALYGARAANGVIQITTSGGSRMPDGETSFIIRSEFGRNELQNSILRPEHHYFRQDNTGAWTDAAGNALTPDTILNPDSTLTVITTREKRQIDEVRDSTLLLPGTDPLCTPAPDDTDCWTKWSYAVADNPYYTPIYDQIDLFYNPGTFFTNSIHVQHRSGATNFSVNGYSTSESGVVDGLDGFQRRGARLNLDHRIGREFDFSANAYFSQSVADDPSAGGDNPFWDLAFTDPDVKLDTLFDPPRDSQDFLVPPVPGIITGNPLYAAQNSDVERTRGRTMGSIALRWRPATVFDLSGDLSYDRSDRNTTDYYFKGYRTNSSADWRSQGALAKHSATTNALNASLSATFTKRFGLLNTVFKGRALVERTKLDVFQATAWEMVVTQTKDLDMGTRDLAQVTGSSSEVKSLGYFLSTQLDLADRYIADLLIRRDGSSLFGADKRWHTYYRLSASYRISMEPWWPLSFLNEFKLRFSQGTAGGRPQFEAQYETYAVEGGAVSKGTLGNRDLKPEHATERELGVDLIALGRLSMTVTYATSTIENQILRVPLISYYGFTHQWQNAGTLETDTWEGTLQAAIVQTPSVGWNLNFVIDRTRGRITEFDLPPYRSGSGGAFYVRDGEEVGTLYGMRWATNCGEILTESGFGAQAVCDGFRVNDDGYLVPVGVGNSYTDGIDKHMYGSKITLDGTEFDWGLPVAATEVQTTTLPDGGTRTDTTEYVRMGNTQPRYSFGIGNTLRWKGFSFYALFDAQMGGHIYNNTRQGVIRWLVPSADVDQAGKSENQKKPTVYYNRLYSIGSDNSHFVEDGTNLKLRELTLRYTFGRSQLEGILGGFVKRLSLAVIGRNLHTWTGYTGYDPEVAGQNSTVYRYDSSGYPNYRSFTGMVEIEF